jgi:hypothetical protein
MKQSEYHDLGLHCYRDMTVDLTTHQQFETWAAQLGTHADQLIGEVLKYLAEEPSGHGEKIARRADAWYAEAVLHPTREQADGNHKRGKNIPAGLLSVLSRTESRNREKS